MKVDSPTYEPTGAQVNASDLYNTNDTETLIEEIKSNKFEPEVEKMLLAAAERFTIFDFAKAAEYYSQSKDKNVRKMMERLALVIVDYDSAIEYGFVKLQDGIMDERV